MNLVEKLLKVDARTVDELKKKKVLSSKLAEVLGESEPVEITIQELPAKRLNELAAKQYGKNGEVDASKAFDARAIVTGEAVIEPNLKDENLQSHFGCTNSKDLAAKLFKNEIAGIADEVSELTGIGGITQTDEEIKN